MPNYPDVQLFIDGKWREGAEGKTLPIIDPATEVEIGRLAHATRPDLDAALKAAEKGFEIWRNTSVFDNTHQPSISVPNGFDADGLPTGLMISTALFEDARALRIGHAYQQATQFHLQRPSL